MIVCSANLECTGQFGYSDPLLHGSNEGMRLELAHVGVLGVELPGAGDPEVGILVEAGLGSLVHVLSSSFHYRIGRAFSETYFRILPHYVVFGGQIQEASCRIRFGAA